MPTNYITQEVFGGLGVETIVPVYHRPEGEHPFGEGLPVKLNQLELIADIDKMRQPLVVRMGETAFQITKILEDDTLTLGNHLPHTGLYNIPDKLDVLRVTNLTNGTSVSRSLVRHFKTGRPVPRKNSLVIGRGYEDSVFTTGDLHIADPTVSRKHALIGLTSSGMVTGEHGKIFALDLGSTNGTSVVVHEMDADKVAVVNPFEENPFES